MDGVMMPSPGPSPGPGPGGRIRMRLKSAASALCAGTAKRHFHCRQSHHTYPKISAPPSLSSSPSPSPSLASLSRAFADRTPTSPNEVSSSRRDSEDVTVVDSASAGSRIIGKISREALAAWSTRVGVPSNRAPADVVQPLFNDLHLYPSKTQVFEMLVCARQCARRGELSLSFGEFCVFAAELKRRSKCRTYDALSCKSKNNGASPLVYERDFNSEFSENLIDSKLNKLNETGLPSEVPSYEVFLGGSCNPTTWRVDVAIPALEKMGITYFNPQVADWSKDLIEIEHRAKQSARVLFFVLDAETRAAAAAVEAAYLAASTQSRHLILVLQPYSRGQSIGGELVPDQEYLDLSRGQAILQEVAERRDLFVFNELDAALRCTQRLLRGGGPALPQSISGNPSNTSAIAKHLMMLKHAFDNADENRKGSLSLTETVQAVKSLTGNNSSAQELENIIIAHIIKLNEIKDGDNVALSKSNSQSKRNCSIVNLCNNISIDYEMFYSILAEISADTGCSDDQLVASSVRITKVEQDIKIVMQSDSNNTLRLDLQISENSVTSETVYRDNNFSKQCHPSTSIESKSFQNNENLRSWCVEKWHRFLSRLHSTTSELFSKLELSTTKFSISKPQEATSNHSELPNKNGFSDSNDIYPKNGTNNLMSAIGREIEGNLSRNRLVLDNSTSENNLNESEGYVNRVSKTNGKQSARKLSVVIPKSIGELNSSNDLTDVNGSNILTPQTSRRLDNLAESVRDEIYMRDVYLGGSCVVRTNWRDETVLPILDKNNLSYYIPAINDYNRMFSAPPYTPAGGTKFTFDAVLHGRCKELSNSSVEKTSNTSNSSLDKIAPTNKTILNDNSSSKYDLYSNSNVKYGHIFNNASLRTSNDEITKDSGRIPQKHERSPAFGEDQPEKRLKYSRDESPTKFREEDIEFRKKMPMESSLPLQSINNSRLSASDFYRISEGASPAPFRGMLDERHLKGSRVLLFGVTSDTRCLAPMVLAAHCIGLRPQSVVLCVQLLKQPDGLSEQAIKDYNRGRYYLIDLARKKNVPVFDDIEMATHCVVEKLKNGDY